MFSKKTDDNFFEKSILNSLESNICLLDEKGNIEFTNESWLDFAKENDAVIEEVSEGCNYLEVCDNVEGDHNELAKQVAAGIRSVIVGEKDKFELEYPCHSPSQEHWFLARVTPYRDLENTSMRKVVVSHNYITERKEAEKKLQESYKKIEIKQRQIDEELEKAKKIHERTLLGKFSKIGSPEDISLEAHYYPAKQIGGDLYNFVRTENKLIIYLSDVTGHGIEAAIISTFVKETIENYADLETGELTPEKILTHVYKQYIKDDFPEDYFVCLYVAVLDLDTYELTYSAAGMQFPPFMKLADGSCYNLQSEGPPISNLIGLELMDFRADSVTLSPGSIILFYTDGIAEQINEDNSSYKERLKNTFYSQHSKFPPELVKQVINNDFLDFNASLQGDDDITYVILQMNPPERKQYNWQLNSTSQELEKFYSEVFPVISEYVNEETTIQGLYELVVNAMEHGNNFDSNKKVYVQVVLTNDYVFATVEDQGDGFNWKEKVAAKSQDIIDSEKERGRGILMARMLCDRLFYNEKGNKAFLILESEA